jgi:gluconokinase
MILKECYVQMIMVMGVSGSGKTTLGGALAETLQCSVLDCDDLHPQQNIEKMRQGQPLDDADREPWLAAICHRLAAFERDDVSAILACSALKRKYRSRFRAAAPRLRFVYLKSDKSLIERRLSLRQGHFMPAGLLESQLAALEEPDPEEHVIVVQASLTIEEQLLRVSDHIGT